MAMKLPSCWRSSYGFSSPSLRRFLASTPSLRRNVPCSLVPLCHKATVATLPSPFSYSSPSPSSSSSSSLLHERRLAFASPTEKSHGFSSLSPSSPSESSSSSSSNKNYLSLPDKELLAQCEVDTFRASGPGGQHRNKTESAVRLRHLPTGLVGQASDDRSQHKNRVYALERLRQEIALKVRRPVDLTSYEIPPELQRIIPKPKNEKKNSSQIGPNHQDYPQGSQALLDLVWATNGVISDAASTLGLSTGVFF